MSKTPLERNARLSALADADVWLKREDLQTVRSYKARGAFNLIAQLSSRETGPALVGIELASPRDRPGLLARMDAVPPRIERIEASSPIFRFLL